MTRAAVITVSDSVALHGARDDSGPRLVEILAAEGYEAVEVAVVADEPAALRAELKRASELARLVVTTGGTGLGPRDRTPEATVAVCEYLVPGLAEEIRRVGRASTPGALLGRGVAGVRGVTLILNLPGSPRGAEESLRAVLAVLPHALDLIAGRTAHSGDTFPA